MPYRCLIVMAGLLLGAERVPGQPPGGAPLRWGTDAEGGAPYIFRDPANPDRYLGFEVEITEALAKILGRPIAVKQHEFKELTLALERGDFDFAMNGIEATPDRQARYRLGRPYYVYQQQLVVRADEARFSDYEQGVKLGITVGTMEDTAADRILTQHGVKKKLYNGPTDAYRDLELGRTDAVLLDLPMAVEYALTKKSLRFAGDPFAKGYYVIVFRKDQEDLARQFDAGIEQMLKEGTLRRILEKWKLWNGDQRELENPIAINGEARGRYSFDRYMWLLGQGAIVTIRISIFSMLLAILLGLPIALARLYGPWWLHSAAIAYVEFFRGIPVLFLLYVLYYGVPALGQAAAWFVGQDLAAEFVAVVAFGLNYAAYEAEIYRAGLSAVPKGQWEAAAALGMSAPLTFRRIILPQALRGILPPMTNDFVALFKDTSLVSAIALVDLSKQYLMLSKPADQYLEIGVATATLYLLMSVPLGYLSRHLEKKWAHD